MEAFNGNLQYFTCKIAVVFVFLSTGISFLSQKFLYIKYLNCNSDKLAWRRPINGTKTVVSS